MWDFLEGLFDLLDVFSFFGGDSKREYKSRRTVRREAEARRRARAQGQPVPVAGSWGSSASSAIGWYPDPSHEAGWRWWDGRAWTHDVTDDPAMPPKHSRPGPSWQAAGRPVPPTPSARPVPISSPPSASPAPAPAPAPAHSAATTPIPPAELLADQRPISPYYRAPEAPGDDHSA